MALGHDDCIPQNVHVGALIQALEPLKPDPIHVNVFFQPRGRVVKYRDHVLEFTDRDAFDAWTEGQSRGFVGLKGAIGITNLSWHGHRQEKSFVSTNRAYVDYDKKDPEAFRRTLELLAPTGLRFSMHESSGSVALRSKDESLQGSAPLKWHLDFALSRTLANPLDAIYPAGETEGQEADRLTGMSEFDQKSQAVRDDYLRRDWKRKQHFFSRWLSELVGLTSGGEAGFDLNVHQMCQLRYLGVKFAQSGPDPVVWNSRGGMALNFERFLELAGYEPLPFKPYEAVVRTITAPSANGPREYKLVSGGLADEIRRRITPLQLMNQLLPWVETRAKGRDFVCLCPFHVSSSASSAGGPNGYVNFAFFRSGDGAELWKCQRECSPAGGLKSSGDVIKLAQAIWKLSRHAALVKLVEYLGIDASKFRGHVEADKYQAPANPNLRVPLVAAKPASSAKKFLAGTKGGQARAEDAPKALLNVASWIETYKDKFKSSDDLFSAMAKTVLVMQGEQVDLEGAAATLAKLGSGGAPPGAPPGATCYEIARVGQNTALFDVAKVYERVQAKLPTRGTGFLKKVVGDWGLHQLANCFRLDGFSYTTALKSLVGFSPTDGADRSFLYDQWEEHAVDPGRMPNLAEKGSEEYAKHEKRRATFMNALRRPGVCCKFVQVMTGDGNRNLGKEGPNGQATELKRKIVCMSKICLFCSVLQAVSEGELLEDRWQGQVSEKHPVNVVKGTVEKLSYLPVIKDKLSRLHDAKLVILGWGDDCKAELTVFVNDDGASTAVESALSVSQAIAAGREGGEIGVRKTSSQRVTDLRDAVGIAVAARISFNLHGRRLLEEQREDELGDWLWWAIGKVPVRNPAKEEALHWPTKAQVKEQAKSKKGEDYEPDLLPGEKANYELRCAKTNYVIARSQIPFGIDGAATAARVNMGYRDAIAKFEAEQRKARGQAPAIDPDNHRFPLRGAASLVA